LWKSLFSTVLWIGDILVRICGSIQLNYMSGSGSCSFRQCPLRYQQK
jgi:hypothetical protein